MLDNVGANHLSKLELNCSEALKDQVRLIEVQHVTLLEFSLSFLHLSPYFHSFPFNNLRLLLVSLYLFFFMVLMISCLFQRDRENIKVNFRPHGRGARDLCLQV